MIDLAGRKALVTGGAGGIGLATAVVLAGFGARVAICDRDDRALSASAGNGGAYAVRCDVSDANAVEAMVAEVAKELGGLDIVVNCAGIGLPPTSTLEQEIDRWQNVIDVNLRGTYLVCRAAGRQMVEAGSGAIVNVASVIGLNSAPRRTAYGASKAGVAWITRSLAAEWGSAGIRVNAVAPGYVRTPLLEDIARAGGFDMARIERRTPVGRLAEPSEIGRVVAFLASDLASYVTGAIVPVDGGWTSLG